MIRKLIQIARGGNTWVLVFTWLEIWISSSVGEDGPQRLPWTAATGQIAATGVRRRKKLLANTSDSRICSIPFLNVLFLECNRFCTEGLWAVYISLSQQWGLLCRMCSAAGVYQGVRLVFARSGSGVGERDLVFFLSANHLHYFGWEQCEGLQNFQLSSCHK